MRSSTGHAELANEVDLTSAEHYTDISGYLGFIWQNRTKRIASLYLHPALCGIVLCRVIHSRRLVLVANGQGAIQLRFGRQRRRTLVPNLGSLEPVMHTVYTSRGVFRLPHFRC